MTARTRRQWWERPRLHDDEDRDIERRVGWLELFYDLIYVVVVSEAAHYLSDHITVAGVLGYTLLFAAIFWAWIGGTFYSERFETQDLSFRIFTLLQILTVAAMAVYAHAGLTEGVSGFALSYAANRLLLWAMWVRAGIHDLRFRPVAVCYAIGFGISIACFIASAFISPPQRYGLWLVALLFDFLTPITTLQLQARLPRFSSSKLPERFGLFIIIVLGEAIVGTIRGVAEQQLTVATAGLGALGIALAFGLWWVYFDYVARRPPRRGVWWQLAWTYLHLPLAMSIAAVGAAIENVVAAVESSRAAALLAGSVGAALLAIALLELTLRRAEDEPTRPWTSFGLKAGAAAVAVALAYWWRALPAALLLLLLLLLLVVQMIYGAWTWYSRQPELDEPAPETSSAIAAEEAV